jgi:hypothetical protein
MSCTRPALSLLLLLMACDRKEPAVDLLARFAALAPECGAPEPYTPPAPLKIGVAEVPLDDASIRDTVTCRGADAQLVLSRDEHQAPRALQLIITAASSAEVRPRIEPPLTGLVPPEGLRHILADLDQVISEPHRVGELSVQSRGDLPPPEFLGPQPRTFTVRLRWR